MESDNLIWNEIRERRQKVTEKAPMYVAVMENLFSRLSHLPSEMERVRYIRHNLLPTNAQSLSLYKIRTISQLISLCRQLEDTRLYSETASVSVTKVPEQNNDEINNTLTELVDKISKLEPKLNKLPQVQNNLATINNKKIAENTKTCWNCRKQGHLYNVCRAPRVRIFCYGCGKDGVSKNKCEFCSKNTSRGRH